MSRSNEVRHSRNGSCGRHFKRLRGRLYGSGGASTTSPWAVIYPMMWIGKFESIPRFEPAELPRPLSPSHTRAQTGCTVCVRVSRLTPQAEQDRPRSLGENESDGASEILLASKQREDFLIKGPGQCPVTIRLCFEENNSCEHVVSRRLLSAATRSCMATPATLLIPSRYSRVSSVLRTPVVKIAQADSQVEFSRKCCCRSSSY